jgi:hypothetical protein
MFHGAQLKKPSLIGAIAPNERYQKLWLLFAGYLILKAMVVAGLVYLTSKLFDRGYFLYVDFDGYLGCNHRSLNSFFSSLVCALNINSIATPSAILISLLLNTIRDLGYIWIATHYFRRPVVLIFALLLASHPYLGLYHAKLATSCFATLGVFIFVLGHLLIKRPWYLDLIQIMLTGFRNGLAALYILDYCLNLLRRMKYIALRDTTARPKEIFRSSNQPVVYIALILVIVNIPDQSYLNTVSDSLSHYVLNAGYFVNLLNLPENIMGIALGYILLLLTNLVLLTGFREAAFTNFPDYFLTLNAITVVSISIGIMLAAFHIIGLFYFAKWCIGRCPALLLVFILVIPSLFFVAHMRYLLPLMPLAIFGTCNFFEEHLVWRKVG